VPVASVPAASIETVSDRVPPEPTLSCDSSASSNGSPPSDIQDDDSFGSNIEAYAATPIKVYTDSPVFIEYSPKSDYHNFFHSSPVDAPPNSLDVFGKSLNKVSLFDFAEEPVPKSSVPWGLGNTPNESYAIPYFFRSHVLWHRDHDSQRGFLELLPDMYDATSPSSLLHKATYAVALGSMSNTLKSRPLRCEARRTYGKALQELGVAIRTQSTARSDELLMAVLLFSLYEQITLNLSAKTAWTSHVHGAVSLIKLRGKGKFMTPRSTALFRAVRTVMVRSLDFLLTFLTACSSRLPCNVGLQSRIFLVLKGGGKTKNSV